MPKNSHWPFRGQFEHLNNNYLNALKHIDVFDVNMKKKYTRQIIVLLERKENFFGHL